MNEAVKQTENRHRLEGYQKRLDTTSLERASNPLAAEFKVRAHRHTRLSGLLRRAVTTGVEACAMCARTCDEGPEMTAPVTVATLSPDRQGQTARLQRPGVRTQPARAGGGDGLEVTVKAIWEEIKLKGWAGPS